MNMPIKVLQGLNLEYPGSTIIISLESPISTNLLDKIQGFHGVFMDAYKLKSKELTVHTKLTHLWVEIGKALQKMASQDWSEDYTEKYVLEVIIKKQINSMSTIPILIAAQQEGLEITQYYVREGMSESAAINRYYAIGCGQESNTTCSISSSKDAYIAQKTQRDKILTNTVIQRLGIPLPKWVEITSKEDIDNNWEDFSKPIVIKPTGLTGGNGVTTRIKTKTEAYKAFKFTQEIVNAKVRSSWQTKIMMQEQVSGEDYRLLVINGKFEIATKRIPAHVIGDGVQSIEQLIAEINKDSRRDVTNPTHTLKPILVDESLTDFLQEQGLKLDYIPKRNEQVFVRKVASMSKGGITEDFTEKVHPQIKHIVEALSASIHAYVVGVDVLCKDISKPLTPQNGAIIECNTMPEAYLNSFPVIGQQHPNIGKIFLNGLIGTRTKRIVYVGKDLSKAKTYLKTRIDFGNETIGICSTGTLYTNDYIINQPIELPEAFEALKLNAKLSTILHHLSAEEVANHGLGFERIDIAIVDKDIVKTLETLEGYKNLGLISEIKAV